MVIDQEHIVLLDGAMGTMLQKSGLRTGELPELLALTRPELLENIHRQYIDMLKNGSGETGEPETEPLQLNGWQY